jgi:hypothetical protein
VTTQPEALRLAAQLEGLPGNPITGMWARDGDKLAAAELRRLHEVNQELLAALKEVYTTCDWHGDDGQEAMMKARAAIAKGEAK